MLPNSHMYRVVASFWTSTNSAERKLRQEQHNFDDLASAWACRHNMHGKPLCARIEVIMILDVCSPRGHAEQAAQANGRNEHRKDAR